MASSFQAYGLQRLKWFFALKYFLDYLHKWWSAEHCTPSFTGKQSINNATSNKAVRCQNTDAQGPLAFSTASISCIFLFIYLSPQHFYLDCYNTSVYYHPYSICLRLYTKICVLIREE